MQRVLYILLNLFAFPGLGTFFSGRKIAGLCQLGLAITGFVLSLLGAGILLLKMFQSGTSVIGMSQAVSNETLMPLPRLLLHLGLALGGILLFGISWIWAALTPQNKTPPPLPGASSS